MSKRLAGIVVALVLAAGLLSGAPAARADEKVTGRVHPGHEDARPIASSARQFGMSSAVPFAVSRAGGRIVHDADDGEHPDVAQIAANRNQSPAGVAAASSPAQRESWARTIERPAPRRHAMTAGLDHTPGVNDDSFMPAGVPFAHEKAGPGCSAWDRP